MVNNIKKWCVIDDSMTQRHLETVEIYESKEEALAAAKAEWNHMTYHDQKRCDHFVVALCDMAYDEDEETWYADMEQGYEPLVDFAGTSTVREIVTLKGWVDGSGWSYTTCYSDQVIDVPQTSLLPGADMDWSWWYDDEGERPEDEDVRIIVEWYDPFGDEDSAPLASWETWASEI